MLQTRYVPDDDCQFLTYEEKREISRQLLENDDLIQSLPALNELGEKFQRDTSPLISLKQARMIFELIELLKYLGLETQYDKIDHPWGFVRWSEDGYRLAWPREIQAAGNWVSDDPVVVAMRMFEDHLLRNSVVGM